MKCMAPAGVEPAPRRLRVGRSPLSYGAEQDVAGRDRTCGAPRFKRPLYRAELRPRGMGEAGFEPATSCVLDKHSGQAELLAHVMMRSSGTRARTSVSAPLNNGVQSVASCRLDDPGKQTGAGRALRPPRMARSTQWHHRWRPCAGASWHVRATPNDVVHATRLPFDPGSPAS